MKRYFGLRISDCGFIATLWLASSLAWSQESLSYEHPDKSFTLQFPVNWTQSTPKDPAQDAYFAYPKGQIIMAELIVFVESLVQEVHVQFYASSAEQNSMRGLMDYQKINETMLVIDNKNAIYRQFKYSQATSAGIQPIIADDYYFVSSNAAYTFHFGTYPHLYDQMKPQFDQIIQNLHLFQIDPVPPRIITIQNAPYPSPSLKPMETPAPQTAIFSAQATYAGPVSSTTNEGPMQRPAAPKE